MIRWFPSTRAAGALAVLALLIVSIAGAMLYAWAEVGANWSAVDIRSQELEALRKRLEMARPAAAGSAIEGDPFLEGATYALAANALQQRVVKLVEASGGTLLTVGVDPADRADEDAGRRVTVQAVAEMSNDGLQEVLYHLEAELPFVFVESLNATRSARGGGGESEKTSKAPLLAVDLRISGFYRKAGS